MELQYYGANCLRITTKKANIIIDGSSVGGKSMIKNGDTVLFTDKGEKNITTDVKLVIDMPGEYEVADTSIVGVPARSYKAETGTFDNTIFKIECEDIRLAFIGNVHPTLTDSQLELLVGVDIVIIPVGNHETTISGSEALSIVKNIEPYIVVPTHFADSKIKYESAQASLAEALKELAMEPSETVPKLKVKASSFNEGDSTKLVVLES
jgi:L-ascorbate metabolism protein UlaG (beta-lactamase superfamily)